MISVYYPPELVKIETNINVRIYTRLATSVVCAGWTAVLWRTPIEIVGSVARAPTAGADIATAATGWTTRAALSAPRSIVTWPRSIVVRTDSVTTSVRHTISHSFLFHVECRAIGIVSREVDRLKRTVYYEKTWYLLNRLALNKNKIKSQLCETNSKYCPTARIGETFKKFKTRCRKTLPDNSLYS